MAWYDKQIPIEEFKGQTIVRIDGLTNGSDEVHFYMSDGRHYKMYHDQDCCEFVEIDDVSGDVNNLIGEPITIAEERTSDKNPEGVSVPERQESFTWTFYVLATVKGYVNIRWYGESNGYYSESVDIIEIE